MRKCLNCNNDFEPGTDKKKFCSDKCRVSYWRKNKKQTDKKVVQEPSEWMKRVEDYCSNAGILPNDLIEFHKEFSSLKLKFKKPKPKDFDGEGTDKFKMDEAEVLPEEVKEGKGKEEKTSGYSYHDSYRKSKLGF